MCLIVVKNKLDSSFSVEDFKASFTRNSDGTGIMYVKDGRVVVEKTMGDAKEHLDLYYKHMNKSQFILHHRFATQGEKTELNCHPFKVLSIDEGDPYDLYFAHNGNIPMSKFSVTHDKKFSDTNLFAQEYLAPLMRKYPDIIEDSVFQHMLHDTIGTGNKLAFLRNDNRIWIFNKSQGDEHNGCWLSNKYSIATPHNAHVITTYYGKNHGSNGYGNYSDPYGSDYDYEDGTWWRENYNATNKTKVKCAETATGMPIDDLLTALTEYQGMPQQTLEDLFISEPHLVYDMINLLSKGTVAKTLLDESADKVAEKLYDLLQAYGKQLTKVA